MTFLPIPDSGVKKVPDPGPDPQHSFLQNKRSDYISQEETATVYVLVKRRNISRKADHFSSEGKYHDSIIWCKIVSYMYIK